MTFRFCTFDFRHVPPRSDIQSDIHCYLQRWEVVCVCVCVCVHIFMSICTACVYIYTHSYTLYSIYSIYCIYIFILRGPLNLIGWRTFWGVQLFSGKRMATVVPGSSLDRITWLYHFTKWFLLFQMSYSRKITKTHNNTGQTNKYSKQKNKIDRSCPCFCHKIAFYYVWKAHSLLSLSLPHKHTYCFHTP